MSHRRGVRKRFEIKEQNQACGGSSSKDTYFSFCRAIVFAILADMATSWTTLWVLLFRTRRIVQRIYVLTSLARSMCVKSGVGTLLCSYATAHTSLRPLPNPAYKLPTYHYSAFLFAYGIISPISNAQPAAPISLSYFMTRYFCLSKSCKVPGLCATRWPC